MTVIVQFLHPKATMYHVGEVPLWLDERNPKPAREQINDRYGHGGGWQPMHNFEMHSDEDNWLRYPGDDPLKPIAMMRLREERIFVYEHAIFAIVQPNGKFEAARLD